MIKLPENSTRVGKMGEYLKNGPSCSRCKKPLYSVEGENDNLYYCNRCFSLYEGTGETCSHCDSPVVRLYGEPGEYHYTNHVTRIIYRGERRAVSPHDGLTIARVQARVFGKLKESYPESVGIRTLAKDLGISKAKIREALIGLREKGLISTTRKGSRWLP